MGFPLVFCIIPFMYFDPKALFALSERVRAGEIGIFPFDTIWGIGGLATEAVIERIRKVKRRAPEHAFLLVMDTPEKLQGWTEPVSPACRRFLEKNWPGPVTCIFKKPAHVPGFFTGGRETIAIRCPDYVPLTVFLSWLGAPMVSTSVNVSGQPSGMTEKEWPEEIVRELDFVFTDIAPLYQTPSSIVDVTGEAPRLVRAGAPVIW